VNFRGYDLLRALDESRRPPDDLNAHRHSYATAARSRFGRVYAVLRAIKALLLGGPPLEEPAGAGARPEAAEREGAWPREARESARRRIAELETNLRELNHAIDELRAQAVALRGEREREDAQRDALRSSLESMQAFTLRTLHARKMTQLQLEHLEREIAPLRRNVEEAMVRIADLGHEAELERVAADRLRSALAQARNAAERERRSAQMALRVAHQLADERFVPFRFAPTLPRSDIEDKRFALAAKLEPFGTVLSVASPDVSVIIPTYRQAAMTLDCLLSIAETLEDGPTIELIVVDDASPDDASMDALSRVPYVSVVRNGTNLGFLRSCNRASLTASGRYLHFLNNDTLVRRGWLAELLACAEADERIGAVGSKLLFSDGSLQEAGGIIWRDASGWNYGRGDDPEDPRYNYVRDVDYCSGASLLVSRKLFEELGRFDDSYAPAYYEDCDLCFAMRDHGHRVVYQPKSEVVHLEGASSGTSLESGVKRHQVLNQPRFASRWEGALRDHFAPDSVPGIRAARRLQPRRTLLMVDSYVPEFDKDAGSSRIFNIIQLFAELDYSVIFVPDNGRRTEPYTTALQNLGVEVVYMTAQQNSIEAALRERLPLAGLGWISRPELAAKYARVFRENEALPLVYDTVDLHYVRGKRELELKRIFDESAWAHWELNKQVELNAIRSADVAITVTQLERSLLEDQAIENVLVIPTIHDAFERVSDYQDTSGILFIGGYNHPPNVDAVLWLCTEIMPIVWARLPNVTVTIIGSNMPESIRELASSKVLVEGYVPEVAPFFERARVFAAPLRYGAGMKGKIGQAFSHAIPTVTTSIGAEGFDLVDGLDALIANDATGFADAIVRLYGDRQLWKTLSSSAAHNVRRFGHDATRERLAEVVEFASRRHRELHASGLSLRGERP
jgi:GT2 family glycosyltransferase